MVLLALTGCSFLPLYTPAPGDKTATVAMFTFGTPSICYNGQRYKLNVEGSGTQRTAVIPANTRVSISTYMSYQGYNVISSCYPGLSMVPRADTRLVLYNGLHEGKCFIEAVREDHTRETGVAIEPTLSGPKC